LTLEQAQPLVQTRDGEVGNTVRAHLALHKRARTTILDDDDDGNNDDDDDVDIFSSVDWRSRDVGK
jgi:hypothetical protein